MELSDSGAADVDKRDLDLLAYIENDFDASLEEIAEDLDLSKSTVHYRLQKLREKDVIEGVSVDIDPLVLGLNIMVITEIMVTHESGYIDDIGEALADIDGVQQVLYTMGDVDFIVMSRAQDRSQINDIVDGIVSIPGVNKTSSTFVMKEIKTDGKPVSNMSEKMLDNIYADEE